MLKTKTFDVTSQSKLDALINDIAKAKYNEITDIKYSTYIKGEEVHYTALVIYIDWRE